MNSPTFNVESFAQRMRPARVVWDSFVESIPNMGIPPGQNTWAYFWSLYRETLQAAGIAVFVNKRRLMLDGERFPEFALQLLTQHRQDAFTPLQSTSRNSIASAVGGLEAPDHASE